MRRVLLCCLPLFLLACEPPLPKLSGSGMDMFAPTAIRLHPLSRILGSATTTAPATQPAGGLVLEARVELTDQFSDPTKSPGTLKLELFDQPPLTHKGPLLQTWSYSIDTPQDNQAHWDRTTRTYFFKLPLNGDLPKRDHLLAIVTLTLPNGAALTDELEIPLK